MKALKIIGTIIAVIIGILLVVVAMQPPEGHIEKSIVINASPAAVFPHVSQYKNFNVWSPWAKMDPEAKQSYEGTDGTLDARMSWEGPKTGTGSQWIVELDPDKHVRSGMKFGGADDTFFNDFFLEPDGNGTRVTWTYDGSNNGLSGKAFWLVMQPMMSGQYEEGLEELKNIVEGQN